MAGGVALGHMPKSRILSHTVEAGACTRCDAMPCRLPSTMPFLSISSAPRRGGEAAHAIHGAPRQEEHT